MVKVSSLGVSFQLIFLSFPVFNRSSQWYASACVVHSFPVCLVRDCLSLQGPCLLHQVNDKHTDGTVPRLKNLNPSKLASIPSFAPHTPCDARFSRQLPPACFPFVERPITCFSYGVCCYTESAPRKTILNPGTHHTTMGLTEVPSSSGSLRIIMQSRAYIQEAGLVARLLCDWRFESWRKIKLHGHCISLRWTCCKTQIRLRCCLGTR
jgi:hypothetical protein